MARITKAQIKEQESRDAFQAEVQQMSNDKLLWETIYLAGGDDYDGCFSPRGQWEFDTLKAELVKRLQLDYEYLDFTEEQYAKNEYEKQRQIFLEQQAKAKAAKKK